MSALTAATPTASLRRYLDAQTCVAADTLAACRHPDFEIHWPQTNERVPSHTADVQIRGTRDPGGAGNRLLSTPVPVLVRRHAGWQLTGGDAVWIGQAIGSDVNGQTCHVVSVMELEASLVRRETNWVAPSFPRPESRAKLSELEEWRAAPDVIEVAVDDDVAAHRRHAIEAYFSDLTDDPVGTHEAFLHPDATEVMPQSSERIVGRDAMIDVLLSHPNFPTVELRRALVVGDTGLAEVKMTEGAQEFFGIGIFHFRGSKVDLITEYWAPRLDAWRPESRP